MLGPAETPRTDEEIFKDLLKVEENIRNLLKLLVNWVEEDVYSIDPDLMFYDFELIKLRLPTLVQYPEDLEQERKESEIFFKMAEQSAHVAGRARGVCA